MMALPSCRLSSAINYTLLSQQERCSLSPDVRTQTNARAHRGHRGTDTCRVFVTSSVDICDRMALWERRPSVVGKAGLEGDKGARCITLLFSVGLSCVKCCAVTAHGVCCFHSYWCYSSEIIQQQKNLLFKLLSFLLLLLNRLQLPLHSCCCKFKSNWSFSCGHYHLVFQEFNMRANYTKAVSCKECFGFIKTTFNGCFLSNCTPS